MKLFQLSSTPLTFQISFLALIFLFTRVICFVAFFDMFIVSSCFQHVFSLDPSSLMLVHMFICPNLHGQGFYAMFYAQIYIHSCLYVQIYMLRVLCHVSFVSFLSLLCVDVRVMCSHARCHAYGYALLGSMCLYAFCHVLCLDPHPCMLICLDLCVHMFTCLDLCSIFFMPSSMCLCALCRVCVPRPRLCLSCHMPLQSFCRFIFISCVLA